MSDQNSEQPTAQLNDEIPLPILKPKWLHPVGVSVRALRVSPDSQSLAFATDEGGLKILETTKGDVLFEVESQDSFFGVSSLEFSPDGKMLALALENGRILVYDLENYSQIFEESFPKQIPEHLLWRRDSQAFFCVLGKAVVGFHLDGKEIQQEGLCNEENTITSLRWVDGKMLGLTTYSHFKIIESHTGRVRQDFSWKGSLLSLEICPNLKYAVCGTQDQTIHIWNLNSKKDMEMRGFHSKVKQMSFREDGLAMAHGTGSEIIVWDFSGQGPSGKTPQVLGPFETEVVEVHFQNQGSHLVSAGKDGILLFWEPKNGINPVSISGIRDQEITCVSWAPDDSYVVVGFAQGYVTLVPFAG